MVQCVLSIFKHTTGRIGTEMNCRRDTRTKMFPVRLSTARPNSNGYLVVSSHVARPVVGFHVIEPTTVVRLVREMVALTPGIGHARQTSR